MSESDQIPRVSRRQVLRWGAAAGGVAMLPGCLSSGGTSDSSAPAASGPASSAASGAAGSPAPAAGKVTVWFYDPWLKSAVTAFKKVNPNITVDFKQLGYVDVHKRLLTSLAAGSGAPDVCAIDIGYIGSFASGGGLVDLLQEPYGAGKFQSDFVDYKWQQGQSPDGKLVGMPWDIGPAGMWYRQDLFQAAGLPTEPEEVAKRAQTWEDWLALGEELRAKTPNTALFADAFDDIYAPRVEQQGHGWFDGTKVVIAQKAVEPLKMALDAQRRKLDAGLDVGSPEWAAGLRKNAFAAAANAVWAEISQKREQPQLVGKYRVIQAPGGPYNSGGGFMAIPEQSKNKAAAWEFLRFVTADKDGANVGFKAGGVLPAYRPAWDNPAYDEPVPFYGGQKAYRLYLDIAKDVKASPIARGDREASDIVAVEVAKVQKEGKDPAKAMQDAQDKVLKTVKGATA